MGPQHSGSIFLTALTPSLTTRHLFPEPPIPLPPTRTQPLHVTTPPPPPNDTQPFHLTTSLPMSSFLLTSHLPPPSSGLRPDVPLAMRWHHPAHGNNRQSTTEKGGKNGKGKDKDKKDADDVRN